MGAFKWGKKKLAGYAIIGSDPEGTLDETYIVGN